jgi:hypothetical protein
MKSNFTAVLKRILNRQDSKTTSTIQMTEVTLEEQLRILARVKDQNNTTVAHNNPRRSHREINAAYKG